MSVPPSQSGVLQHAEQILQANAEGEGRVLRNRVVPLNTPPPKAPRAKPASASREAIRQAKAALMATPIVMPVFGKAVESQEGAQPRGTMGQPLENQTPRAPRVGNAVSPDLAPWTAATQTREAHSVDPLSKGSKEPSNTPLEQGGEMGRRGMKREEPIREQQPAYFRMTPSYGAVHMEEAPRNLETPTPGAPRQMSPMPALSEAEIAARMMRGFELPLQWVVTAVRESVKEVLSREAPQVRQQTSHDHLTNGRRAPPLFEGFGTKTWLMQIENYHEMLGMTTQDRVKDAVSYLAGRAIREYALERNRGRHPQTWNEFRRWVLTRFPAYSEIETARRLSALRWEGSFDRLCAQFVAILSEGVEPPAQDLIRLFLKALPAELIMLLKDKPFGSFESWIELRDYLAELASPRKTWSTVWLASVDEATARDAETRFPRYFPSSQLNRVWGINLPMQTPERANGGLDYPVAARRPVAKPVQALANIAQNANRGKSISEIHCSTCGGAGHIARVCPTASSQLFKEGARCGRCKGLGHWARTCPSPPSQVSPLNHINSQNGFKEKEGNSAQPNPNKGLGNGKA